ncbi:hypothetical protein ACFY5J_00655 [Peribacillus butanolivorans]|uniref:hypothetical protein n=1 Tax=Peribacillus butanolivorans TaxID=421767 RepID=UPI0036965AD5
MPIRLPYMKFKGKSLHETELLKDPEYHKSLIISGIKATYTFDSAFSKGKCAFDFGFPSKNGSPSDDSEFTYKLSGFSYESETKSKSKIQSFLYAKFDNFKSNAYKLATET